MTFVTTEWTSVPQRIIGAAMDVTEHELLPQELRQREAYFAEALAGLHVDSATQQQPQFEAQLQSTLNVIPAYTWYAAPSGALTFVNKRTADYLSLPEDHPLRFGIDIGGEWDSHISLLHPDDQEESRRVWATCLRTGNAGEFSQRVPNAEGVYRWFLCRAEPLRASDGTLLYWVGVNLDIEERKQAEQKLQAREMELQRILDLTPQHIGVLDGDGTPLSANRVALEYLGVDIERWRDETSRLGLIHPDDRECLVGEMKARFLDGAPHEFEARMLRHDGQFRHHLFRLNPSKDERGNVTRWYGTATDIEELKEAEFYLAEAQRLTHTSSWVWNVGDRNAAHLSEEWYRICGFNPAEGVPAWEKRLERVHPEDRLNWKDTIDRAILEKADYDVNFRIVLPDGKIKWIHTVGHPVLTEHGDVVQFLGSSTDITERKQAEQRLKEQEMELRQMLDLTPQMVAVFGPDRERLYANRIALDYAGITLDEWRNRGNSIGIGAHPDDVEKLKASADHALSTGSAYELEFRLRKSDGSYRWFIGRYNPVCDDKGKIIRWYVACTNIDDRKRAEEKLRHENAALREEVDQTSMFEEIVGTSPALKAVLSHISKVAPSDSTVLITGETGTGKELVARAIHRRSARASRAFVSVNCAAIPRDLIASELFGHEKGAFTGATQRRIGRFELADGGTIFLDEVGELSPDTQVALLRVLQEREFERLGGNQLIHVDVRVVTATNRNLEAAVSNGSFRQDLLYRLNVFPIEVPPLRERKDDILMLVEYFVQRYASRAGKKIRSIDKKTVDLLHYYEWPGNIRELQNVIERSVILCSSEVFSVDESWLSKGSSGAASRVQTPAPLKADAEPRSEREIIEAALAESRGRVSGPSGAAARLGIPPSTLDHRIKALEIDKTRFKFR